LQQFPLIEALWASLDKERPSGDDPARVVSALHRFYTDFQRFYTQGRRNRWKTPLFNSLDPGLRANLERALELTSTLDNSFRADSPLLDELRRLDPEIRRALAALEQEERGFGIAANESPKLMQLDYLFEGWSRGLLPVDPLQTFLGEFQKASRGTRGEIAQAIKSAKPREKELEDETTAIAQATEQVDRLEQNIQNLLANLGKGAAACRPYRDAIMEHGQQLGQSYHRLEKISPPTEPCPFCNGQLSLSGRCRSCGRRLPHLEEIDSGPGSEQPQSPFISNNLRRVDLALAAFNQDPDNEGLWKNFQEAVRHLGRQVDAGRQHVEMLANSPDRPIDPAAPERLDEAELVEISAVFVKAQRALATFAFQPFPPIDDLPDDWREPLLAIEPRMQALERRWAPPAEDDPEAQALPSSP
jgi:hypothetical protein